MCILVANFPGELYQALRGYLVIVTMQRADVVYRTAMDEART